jgi:Raf kinase inhibitor-like YbhB/YbcL family protein
MTPVRAAGVLGLMLGTLAGCGADDRDLRPPSAAQLTTTTLALDPPSDGVGTETELVLQLTSSAFGAEQPIPDQFTCQGGDVSPPLEWINQPAGVTELALAVVDLDADSFVHWLVTGISPAAGGMTEGQVPPGATELTNGFGEVGWGGPCPPAGSGAHRYEFRLLALSSSPGLAAGTPPDEAFEALARLPTLATATLTATATG